MLVNSAAIALRFSGLPAATAGAPHAPAPQRPDAAPEGAGGRAAAAKPVAAAETAAAVRAPEKAEGASGLTDEERAEVERLRRRDAEVRAHEQAHAAVGGPHAGAPQYEYEQGPDGRRYAVGGSVEIDASPVPGDPQATIAKMEIVKRAALAPAEPSAADRAVARKADQHLQEARTELLRERAGGGAPVEAPAAMAGGGHDGGGSARATAAYATAAAADAAAAPVPAILMRIA